MKNIYIIVIILFLSTQIITGKMNFETSQVFSVKVNGIEVFTQYYKTVDDEKTTDGKGIRWPLENVSVCHFSFTGKVKIEVTCNKPFTRYNLSPERYKVPNARNGNTISFIIDKPGKFNINMDNDSVVNEQLFIFAELLEDKPDLKSPDVVNIMSFGVENTGMKDNTELIQKAINGLTPGQTLFFPAGQYLSRTIFLKSNMIFYLEAGAILLGTQKYSDYIKDKGFVVIKDCSNTSIKGYGRIDQRGEKMQADYGSNASSRNIVITGNSSNTLIENILSLDPPRLNIQVSASNTTIRNVKALSTQSGHNTDGMDPWNCRNILYDNCFIYGRDDAIAVKAFGTYTGNITVSNSLFSSLESTMKVGTETECDSITNVTFENCDALYAGWAMSLWSYDKAKIKNISWRNIGVDRLKPSSYTNQGIPLYFEVRPRGSSKNPGNIENISAFNIFCKDKGISNKCFIQGNDPDSKISEVTINDLYIAGTQITAENKNEYFSTGNYVENFSFGTLKDYPLISVTATKNEIIEGKMARFTLHREGDSSKEARVDYLILGNAHNGVDFKGIPSFITFLPGEQEKTINIRTIPDKTGEKIEQVCLSVLASPDQSYMISTNFISVINIKDPGYSGNMIISNL